MSMRIVFNRNAFRELRTTPEVVEDLARRAEAIASAAGEGFEVLPMQAPRNRAHAVVAAVSTEAKKANAEQNTLLRALDAGR